MLRIVFPAALIGLLLPAARVQSAPAREADKEIKAIIAKAIEARGGEANLQKYKARTYSFSGTMYIDGSEAAVSGIANEEAPVKTSVKTNITLAGAEIAFAQVFTGDKGWESINGTTQELDKATMDEVREQMYVGEIAELRGLRDTGVKLYFLGESKVDGKPAIGVRVSCKGRRDVKLFFDKEKGLLLRTESRGKDVARGAAYARVTVYSNYKNVSGLMIPFKEVVSHDDKPYLAIELSEVTVTDKLPDSIFAKP
jgi:hypothetical protein